MDPFSAVTLDPFWIAVGILRHRFDLTESRAVARLGAMADDTGRDVMTEAKALVDGAGTRSEHEPAHARATSP